jgi:S1-C subfamily serine protease
MLAISALQAHADSTKKSHLVDLHCSTIPRITPAADRDRYDSCKLAEALLNRDCTPLTGGYRQVCVSSIALAERGYPFDTRANDICQAADLVRTPALKQACADETARMKKLRDEHRASVAKRRTIAMAEAKSEEDKAFTQLGNCIDIQVKALMRTTETAEAVAAASIQLCENEVDAAAIAIAQETSLDFWTEGPEPIWPTSASEEGRNDITNPLLPRLAAKIMHDRAGATTSAPSDSGRAAPVNPTGPSKVWGTAFLVSGDGKALTNAHVVEGCQTVAVNLQGTKGTARVLGRDTGNDLALLATDLHPVQVPDWRLSARQGDEIVVYGFPLAGVLASEGNVAAGNITALSGLGNDSRFLQISAPVQPGNSGGPVLDRTGAVVGIVVSKLNAIGVASATGDIPQNVTFAIRSALAEVFLAGQEVVPRAAGDQATPLSTPDLADRAKTFTVQVICEP